MRLTKLTQLVTNLTRAESEGSVVAFRGQVPDCLVSASTSHRTLEVTVLVAVEPHAEAAGSGS